MRNLRPILSSINKNKYTLLLIVVIGLGFLSRVYKLDAKEFRLDEDDFVIYAPLATEHIAYGFKPFFENFFFPFWRIAMKSWTNLVGINEFTVRFLTSISGLFSMLLIFKFSHALFGKKGISYIAVILTSFSYLLIYYSRLGRVYSFYFYATLLSFYYFYKLINEKNLQNKILFLFFVSQTLLIQAHPLSFVLLLSQFLILFLLKLDLHKLKKYILINVAALLVNSYYVYKFILRLFTNYGNVVHNLNWIRHPSYSFLMNQFVSLFVGINFIFKANLLNIVLILMTILLILYFFLHSDYKMRIMILVPFVSYFCFILIFSLLNQSFSIFNPDYLVPLLAFSICIVAYCAYRFKYIGILLVMFLIALNAFHFSALYTGKETFHEAINLIVSQSREPTIIIPYPPYYKNLIYHLVEEVTGTSPHFISLKEEGNFDYLKYEQNETDKATHFILKYWTFNELENSILKFGEGWLLFLSVANKPNFIHDYEKLFSPTILAQKRVKILHLDRLVLIHFYPSNKNYSALNSTLGHRKNLN